MNHEQCERIQATVTRIITEELDNFVPSFGEYVAERVNRAISVELCKPGDDNETKDNTPTREV